MALVIAWTMMRVQRRLRTTIVFALLLAATWGTIVYAAFSRPAFMNQAAAQVGFGEATYPDPDVALRKLLGMRPPAVAPVSLYRLQQYRPPTATALSFSETLPVLPDPLPAPSEWVRGDGVSVVPDPYGYVVQGNATPDGAQLTSKPIAVHARQGLLLRIVARIDQGPVCVGIRGDDRAQWVLPPATPRPEYLVYTGDNTRISVVVANCYPDATRNLPTKLFWKSASLARLQSSP
jgi:hypothetical protein